jgi:hypothetical protein
MHLSRVPSADSSLEQTIIILNYLQHNPKELTLELADEPGSNRFLGSVTLFSVENSLSPVHVLPLSRCRRTTGALDPADDESVREQHLAQSVGPGC